MSLKVKAFTLLECLVALLALSGSVLVINGLTKVLQNQWVQAQTDYTADWTLFCEQMRAELSPTNFDRVEQNFLYVTKASGQKIRFGLVGKTFRKTNDKGRGFQPMLDDLESVKIQSSSSLVTIQVRFKKGGERTFIYRFLTTE